MANPGSPEPRLSTGIYTRSFLALVYRYVVIGFNLPYMWKCPVQSVLVPFFSENFSERHLDCGVADGFFLTTALQQLGRDRKQKLTLMDLNPNSLEAAKAAVTEVAPLTEVRTIIADIRAPLPDELQGARFDSISMFNLFHCVPGGSTKFQGIATYRKLLTDDGVLTGCTVLGERDAVNWLSRLYLKLYIWAGTFNNRSDKREDVEDILRQEFEEADVRVVGMVLLFKAKKPRRDK